MSFKMIPSILMSLFGIAVFSQEPSEIYVFDLKENGSVIQLTNPVNVSANPGYDNQPAFNEDGTALFFASERDGQTDIVRYEITGGYRAWLTDTPDSEYSPTSYPGKKKYFTCVRLNRDGSQYLYKYAFKKKAPEILIPELTVGYYLWFNDKVLISFVLGDIETLEVSNFKYKIRYPIEKNIGRSLQRIPPGLGTLSGKVSFLSLEHGAPEIYAIDPQNSNKSYITDALKGSQDLAWTLGGYMLMGNESGLYAFRPGSSESWQRLELNGTQGLSGFSRIAVSPDGKKVAVVVSE